MGTIGQNGRIWTNSVELAEIDHNSQNTIEKEGFGEV